MQEFAHLASGEPPTRDPVTRRLLLPERSCIVFVLLPASPGFVIGAQPTDGNGRNYDPHSQPGEGPPHRVPLAAFLLSKYELTQGQWLALMGDNPSVLLAGTTHLGRRISWLDPVTNIDWLRADQAMRRHGLALPTEAQWEYGCRGGKSTAWWTGNDRDSLRRDGAAANIADHSAFAFLERWPDVADWPDYDDGFPYHAPVGSFRANPFGLSEMHGNVLEWCADGPAEYGSVQPPRPGDGFRSGGKAGHRIARGGSFTAKATLCRSAYRVDVSETTNFLNLGLRPAQRLLP
jgi:formylglycine-generating enzyme required for sulfatase activity